MKIGFDLPSSFWEVWKMLVTDGHADDGACLYYKLTYETKDSGELKIKLPFDEVRGDLTIATRHLKPAAAT